MIAFYRIGLTLFLAFIFVAIVSVIFVYPGVDRMTQSNIGQRLLDAKAEIHQSFAKTKASDWQNISIEVSDKIDMDIYIDKLSKSDVSEGYVPQEYIAQFNEPVGKYGIIDRDMLQVFYPLGDGFVLSAGPLYQVGWISFASEIVTWFIAFFISLLIAYYFYTHDRKNLQTLVNLLPTLGKGGGDSNVIDLITLTRKIEKLAALNDKKSDSLEKLIISQRDLLHGIAHEVRSPLARMEFAIELLQTAGEQEQAELSLQLDKYLKEIDELVRELLRYSRLQHHESEIRLSKTTIGSVIGAGLDKVIDIYPTIQFSLENKGDITMHCDNHLMIIAMANILRNAGRFARTTCVINWLEIDNNVVITIEDDGAGLPPGKVQQIFEPFTRLDPSRTRDSGGHGLGLAIVQAIVHRHNGLVEVSDGELGGAKFQLTIPKC